MADSNKNQNGSTTREERAGVGSPQVGGVSSKDTSEQGVFSTSGPGPVRDKEADYSKGTPVKRFFTKDGTPVEPSSVPPAATPANLAGPDASKREDVVEAFEYLDEGGNTVTHDSLKAKRESPSAGHAPSNA